MGVICSLFLRNSIRPTAPPPWPTLEMCLPRRLLKSFVRGPGASFSTSGRQLCCSSAPGGRFASGSPCPALRRHGPAGPPPSSSSSSSTSPSPGAPPPGRFLLTRVQKVADEAWDVALEALKYLPPRRPVPRPEQGLRGGTVGERTWGCECRSHPDARRIYTLPHGSGGTASVRTTPLSSRIPVPTRLLPQGEAVVPGHHRPRRVPSFASALPAFTSTSPRMPSLAAADRARRFSSSPSARHLSGVEQGRHLEQGAGPQDGGLGVKAAHSWGLAETSLQWRGGEV
ncbi:hypothetical protein NHX12_011811 [Muraenolepis orangiensis]|uniref:Uncharacterized protein n=1 Tax=Muraenolepis orangiensis TaxID=630683 RepID=A0A9Q0DH64_9TELE|nr:hypothetical protein NHX12_011811 [Muraenolepis orangiensis]